MEVSIRPTHYYLVTRFQRKDIRRSDTRHYIHKSGTLFFRLERRGSDTYSQHDTVTFCRIVGHRVSTDCFLFILTFQAQQTEFLPCRQIFFTDQALINVLIIIHWEFRYLDLCVRTRDKVHVFAFRQCHDKLFDKCSHILVGDHFALPLFHAEYRLVNLDSHVTLHFHLTAQTPVVLLLFTTEVRNFRRQDFAATFEYLTFALSARTLTTTSGWQEYTVYGQRIKQCGTGLCFQSCFAIDR